MFNLIGLIALCLAICEGNAQSQSADVSTEAARQGPNITASIMFTGGENVVCRRGNINDAYVVTVAVVGKSKLTRYIVGTGTNCSLLPIILPIGTRLSITGVLQDTAAIPGAAINSDATSINENCFNVEGYSVGLDADSASEFDPGDPANIINAQGYGFFWYDSDSDLKPGPYEYTVAGCSRRGCPIATTYYNTDGSPGTAPACTILNQELTVRVRNITN
jgi:hypothetical protein